MDLYYFFLGPWIFYIIQHYTENHPRRLMGKKLFSLNANLVATIIWILYCIGHVVLFRTTGIRFFSDQWGSQYSNNYIITGLSGILSVVSWLLLMMLPDVKPFIRVIIVVTSLLFSIFSAKRGDAMRILLFVIIFIGFNYSNRIFTTKNFRRLLLIILVALVIFSSWGNYRNKQREWDSADTVGTILESYSNNEILNWVYGYTAINFDVLKQLYIETEHSGEFKEIFLPIIRVVGGSDSVEAYYQGISSRGLHGFNASTFLANFIYEMGEFYFVGIIILSLLIAALRRLCWTVKFRGGYLFLIMLTSIAFSGNYYLHISYFYSIIAGVILYSIISFKKC